MNCCGQCNVDNGTGVVFEHQLCLELYVGLDGKKALEKSYEFRSNALHVACLKGFYSFMFILLNDENNRIGLEETNMFGVKPLFNALHRNDVKMINILLDYGAKPKFYTDAVLQYPTTVSLIRQYEKRLFQVMCGRAMRCLFEHPSSIKT